MLTAFDRFRSLRRFDPRGSNTLLIFTVLGRSGADERTVQVLIEQTELGQLRKNGQKLAEMFARLSQDVSQLDEAVSARNPEVIAAAMAWA
jgi:uncharacterized protein YegL